MAMRHFLVFLFVVSLASTALAEPFRIGISLGLSGKYAELGDMQRKGFELWERDVNDRGGLLGRPVQLMIRDDTSDPAVAGDLYRRFIVEDKVDLVFAPYSSEITATVAPITEKHRYPMLASGAAATSLWQQGYRYLFGVMNTANNYTVNFLELLVSNELNTIAIINADDVASREISEGTREWAKRFGLKVVFTEEFKKGTQNLEKIAQKAQASGAQTLMVCGHFDEAVNARLALKQIGWSPRAYFATVGPLLPKFHDVLKANADGVFSTSQWEPEASFPGARQFAESFNRSYHKMPSYQAAAAYASGQILEAAARKEGSLDREKLREGLSSLDTLTIVGRYGVDRTGKQTRQVSTTVQWQNGKKKTVGPKEVMNANPIWQ
jgi:branched-chain amino acid transport system substrate-binding protein